MTFDTRTVFALLVASALANGLLLLWNWLQYRQERSLIVASIGFLSAGAGSLILAGSAGQLPGFLTSDIGNALILFSQSMIWMVARAFNHRRPVYIVPALAALAALLVMRLTPIGDSFAAQTALITFPGAVFCFLGAAEMLRAEKLNTRRPLALVFGIHGLALIARGTSTFLVEVPEGTEAFEGPLFVPIGLEYLVFVQFAALFLLALVMERAERLQRSLRAELETTYETLRQDVAAASVVQQQLIPGSCRCQEIRFEGRLEPARLIAGDTYNVFEPRPRHIAFFTVDVCGHGAASALVSVSAYHLLTELARTRGAGQSLQQQVEKLNKEWPDSLPYFTMILGELDIDGNRGSLIQAGHPPGLLIHTDGSVDTVGEGGSPIGLISDGSYESIEFDFRPGDRLLLYSDGVTDASSPAGLLFSEERLTDFVRRQATSTTTELLNGLSRALRSWREVDEFEDDVSVVVIERLDVAPRSAADGLAVRQLGANGG